MGDTFYRDAPIYEADLLPAAVQLKREDREEERSQQRRHDSSSGVGEGMSTEKQDSQIDALYDFLTDLMFALNDVLRDLLSMSALPDITALHRIFLAPDRKIYVGAFLVLLSMLYLFVFVNS
jgi:hypothetical protein